MSDLLNKASLVMVPSGYKEDTVYSVIPTDGSGDLSFTRASNGTRVNSAGLVEVVPWNLLQQSETFNVSPWVNENNIVTSNSIVAPNGTTTADTISNSNTTALFRTYEGAITGYAQPQTLTFSTYFKYKDHRYISFGITDDVDYRSQVVIDLQNMVITENYKTNSGDVLTSSIESVGNGWYRIVGTLTYNTALAGGNLYFLYKFQNSGTFYGLSTAQTGTGFYMWGAQLNIGSTAKPYFPTTDRLNVPRLTYQNGGGGCPSLLLEKQSTNLFTYSEDFTNANWVKNNCSISANQTTSPDGTQNADKFVEDTTNSIHRISHTSTATNPTVSIYAKAGERSKVAIFTPPIDIGFDLSNGTVINLGYGTTGASIESVGNGWYRISLQFTEPNPTVYFGTILSSTQVSYTGDGTSGAYFWGAQIEDSSYPTSYIPTTSSSATRVADACSKTGISSLIGQTEGVIFIDVLLDVRQTYTYFAIAPNLGVTSVYIGIGFTATSMQFEVVNSGVQCAISYSNSSTGRFKIAAAYKANDFVLYVNGAQIGTDTSGTVPACSQIGLFNYDTSQPLKYNQVALFPTRLTNAELASLTTI